VDCIVADCPSLITRADARAAIAIAATRSLDEARPVTVGEVGGQSEEIFIKTLDSSLDFY